MGTLLVMDSTQILPTVSTDILVEFWQPDPYSFPKGWDTAFLKKALEDPACLPGKSMYVITSRETR